ncbi:MAG: lytic transglycosylase domain-containing protein [Deltaproteobacteria bacterium]|nr:lytic transglycosylase domain-containing protein [Deltaproteobacteria bacterium]
MVCKGLMVPNKRILTARTVLYGNIIKASTRLNILLCLLVLSLLSLLFLSPCAADVYRYVDESQVIHLTNQPLGPPFKLLFREGTPDRNSANDAAPYETLIVRIAEKYGVDHALVKAVIKAESNFDQKAISKKGARGLMQLMPQTALALGVNDCFRPEDNIDGGIRYLSYLIGQYKGDLRLVLAAYNAGETAVAKYLGVPPYAETQSYVRQVLNHYERYRNGAAMTAASASIRQPHSKQVH